MVSKILLKNVLGFIISKVYPIITGICHRYWSPRNGNYLGMLEVIAQYDDFLSNHLQEHANRGRGHINYLSHHVMEEIIQIMGDTILKEMITRLKQSKYYSVSVDSTPDAAHVDQLTLVLRYMEGKDPVERFFAFMDNPGHCAKDMFIAMTDFLRSNNIEIADCRGQSYDNASAMSGQYNGLQTLIKEENELAEWVPCSAHSLNLVLKDSADSCHAAVDFFYFVEKLFVFFSASTKRTELLNNSEAKLSLKRISTTRWSCRADATKALIKDYKPLQIALEKLSTDTQEKGETRAEAMGLLRRMNTLEIGIYACFWNNILQRANATSKKLQTVKLDLNSAVASLHSLREYIKDKRGEFQVFEREGEELTGATYQVERQSRRKDDISSPSKKFEVQSFLPVIDVFLSSLEKRTKAYEGIAQKFGFFRNITKMNKKDLKAAAQRLVAAYPSDLDHSFDSEIIQFSAFVQYYINEEPKKVSFEQFCYNLLHDKEVKESFPNVEVALRMYLSLMISNCSGERSFSKLKLIQNRLRTSMGQGRLVHLVMMSLEWDILRELDFKDVIHFFATAKSRKVSCF